MSDLPRRSLIAAGGHPMTPADSASAPLWTDDHHNLFDVLQ